MFFRANDKFCKKAKRLTSICENVMSQKNGVSNGEKLKWYIFLKEIWKNDQFYSNVKGALKSFLNAKDTLFCPPRRNKSFKIFECDTPA